MNDSALYTTVTCPCCGESLEIVQWDASVECWECGINVFRPTVKMHRAEPQKTEAERFAAIDEKALKEAKGLLNPLAVILAKSGKFEAHSAMRGACRTKGYSFSKIFTDLVIADERFADIVKVMSPAQKRGDW